MSTRIPNPPTAERAAPDWPACAAGLPPPEQLSARSAGDAVVDHRSSWVRRLPAPLGHVFVKTYEYASWGSILRDFGKRTGPWAKPRTVREFDALTWLAAHGEAAPRPLVALVWRRFGFVARTTLVTTHFPGTAASALLPTLPTAERIGAARAIGAFVHRLHDLGFRDRNLDLRNLLLARREGTWQVAKIDSPRFVLRAAHRPDALARADWQRLLPQLAAFQLDDVAARAAATR